MKSPSISKEYILANKILTTLILLLVSLPFFCIFAEQHNYSPLSSNILQCSVKAQTGKPCPTCGLTRSILLLYKGKFQESLVQYSYGYLFVLLLVVQLFLRLIPFLADSLWVPYMDITQMIVCGVLWFNMVSD